MDAGGDLLLVGVGQSTRDEEGDIIELADRIIDEAVEVEPVGYRGEMGEQEVGLQLPDHILNIIDGNIGTQVKDPDATCLEQIVYKE